MRARLSLDVIRTANYVGTFTAEACAVHCVLIGGLGDPNGVRPPLSLCDISPALRGNLPQQPRDPRGIPTNSKITTIINFISDTVGNVTGSGELAPQRGG